VKKLKSISCACNRRIGKNDRERYQICASRSMPYLLLYFYARALKITFCSGCTMHIFISFVIIAQLLRADAIYRFSKNSVIIQLQIVIIQICQYSDHCNDSDVSFLVNGDDKSTADNYRHNDWAIRQTAIVTDRLSRAGSSLPCRFRLI